MIDKRMAAASAFVIAVGVATGAGMYFIHNGSNTTTTEQTEVTTQAQVGNASANKDGTVDYKIGLSDFEPSDEQVNSMITVVEGAQKYYDDKAVSDGFLSQFGFLYSLSKENTVSLSEIIADGYAKADDDIVKVHVHTNDPGLAIQKALTYGSLTSMKIDNMREEHQEKVIRDAQKASESASAPKKEEPRKENGFIAVAAGDGLADIFRDLGVDYVIEGGQTMNPSTDDVLSAIEQVNADNIFVLPNNGNIILAANQAKNLTEDKEVYVVPSKNIPQGIAAMISFVSGRSAAENAESMEEEMQLIKSGQVTYAVRDTNMDGKDIKQGDFMGLTDKTIVSVGSDLQGTAKELIESLLDEDSELVSLYYGSDATKEQAEQLAEDIESTHEDVEVEVQYGGQPVYSYFISVE